MILMFTDRFHLYFYSISLYPNGPGTSIHPDPTVETTGGVDGGIIGDFSGSAPHRTAPHRTTLVCWESPRTHDPQAFSNRRPLPDKTRQASLRDLRCGAVHRMRLGGSGSCGNIAACASAAAETRPFCLASTAAAAFAVVFLVISTHSIVARLRFLPLCAFRRE